MTEEQLSALLRLKRFEQPPPGYFDQLLADVHRRQRAELLRRPLWRIAVERVQTFFGEHSMGGASYAGAMAIALVVGVASIGLLTPGEFEPAPRSRAIALAPKQPVEVPMLSLQPQRVAVPAPLEAQPFSATRTGQDTSRFPRYVIDARPASYEPSFQF